MRGVGADLFPRSSAAHRPVELLPVRGQFEQAAAEAEKAIGIDPDFSSGYDSLAHNDMYLDRLGDAGETLRRAAAHGLEIDEFAMLRYRIAFLNSDETGMERIAARAREKSGAENWIYSRQAFTLPTRVACAKRGTCPNSRRNRPPWQDNARGRDCGKPERPCARPFSGTMLRPPKGDRRR